MDLTDLVDLAQERIGGAVLWANDDFFAPKENLLKEGKAVFLPHEYTERGKWMDGWESRRRRTPGHDECLVRLGLPGVVKVVVVDTSFFRGNYPERCALEGCYVRSDAGVSALRADDVEWFPLLPEAALRGDHENIFEVEAPWVVSHVRLRIFPDGGVARLRVLGHVVPDWRRLGGTGHEMDVAALEAGARVLACSDMFFGPKHNLILPGASRGMADGWETKRRRGPGHDWVIVALAGASQIRRVEIDTSHFKGNAPDTCRLEGCSAADLGPEAVAWEHDRWVEILPQTKVEPHTRHVFVEELRAAPPVTHVRLHVYPDGGVARLRVYGTLTREARLEKGLAALDGASPARARRLLEACCGSSMWVSAMAERLPFRTVPAVLAASDEIFSRLDEREWREAFAHHPPIGQSRAARELGALASRWSEGEQAGVTSFDAEKRAELLRKLEEGNRAYERKFGFVFLINASGKRADEILQNLELRLGRDAATELAAAADEQRAITRLRLEKLLMP